MSRAGSPVLAGQTATVRTRSREQAPTLPTMVRVVPICEVPLGENLVRFSRVERTGEDPALSLAVIRFGRAREVVNFRGASLDALARAIAEVRTP